MSRREGTRRVATALGSLGAIVAAALVPKCPFCVAAVLSAVGVGVTAGSWLAPMVRPLGFAVAVVAALVFARAEWRRRKQRSCALACGRTDRASRVP
jgi:hypothetical protein